MVPSGPSTPTEGAQPVPSSLLRSNSGMLGGQGGPMPSQRAFPSLMPPRPRYNNVNLMGNVPSVSSLLNQTVGNGIVNPGFPGSNVQRGSVDSGAEPDPLSAVGAGTGTGFNPSPSSFVPTNMVNAVSPSQSGNQMLADQQQSHSQQLEPQNFQHPQLPVPLSNQPQEFQSNHGGLGGMGQVKLESQVNNDQHLPQQQHQQLQSLRALGPVKLEPQQLQPMRNQPHVKMEPQHSEHSILLHQQQQQQQQLLQISRQSSQAAAVSQLNLLQEHRLLQLLQQQQQQQQQHQLLKAIIPQQRYQMQNMPMRSPVKPLYEVGACARRLTQFMYQQKNRPEDNNIEFWRKFVAEFFAPNSKKKWCVSMYRSDRQTTGVCPQDVWLCEICNRKPGRGFEATFEVLPRLFKLKYESGTLEELLYVDMPREYHNPSGQIVLDYAKAIQESVFEQLRVVRDGQLRIVFSQDLKICSWEFCARHHEELIPRKLLIPQVSQLGTAAQKYQASTQNASSNSYVSDLQSNSNVFLSSAKQLLKRLDVPLVNDLGYTKRYVRCLQISEVVNCMKDLIDYSRITQTGPMESLAKFPRRENTSSGFQAQTQPSEDQQQQQQHMIQNSINEQTSTSQAIDMQLVPTNGVPSVNNSLSPSILSTTVSTITGHQNPMVSRPQNPMNSTSSNPCAQTSLPSPPSQSNPSPFQTPTPTLSKNSPANVSMQQQQQSPLLSNSDPTDSQSSGQQIISYSRNDANWPGEWPEWSQYQFLGK